MCACQELENAVACKRTYNIDFFNLSKFPNVAQAEDKQRYEGMAPAKWVVVERNVEHGFLND